MITRGDAPAIIENNIFYKPDDVQEVTENWEAGNQSYDHNLYYNLSSLPEDLNKQVVAAGTELLCDDSAVPIAADRKARPHDGSKARPRGGTIGTTVFDGFKPVAGSAAINAGKPIVDANGSPAEKDFLGNPIAASPTIGAIEATGSK